MSFISQFLVLLSICVIGIPGFYVYDSIAVLGPFMVNDGFTKIQIAILYNCYYYPNVVFSFIAGIVVDKYGENKSSIFFSILTTIAQFTIVISKNFTIMCIGRGLLGIAGEAIFICQLKMFTTNFPHNTSTIFAISMIFNRGCSWLSYLTLPLFNNWTHSLYLCTLVCILSLIINIIFVSFNDNSKMKFSLNDGLKECLKNRVLWLLIFIAFFFYGTFASFNALSPILVKEIYSGPNFVMSFLFLGSMIFTPIIGYLSDKFGYRNFHMGFGILIAILVFSEIILLRMINIIILAIMLGYSFGVVPNLIYTMSSMSTTHVGIATGLIEMSIASSSIIFPFIFSFLVEKNKTFLALSISNLYLAICFILNFIISIYSYIYLGSIFSKPKVFTKNCEPLLQNLHK